MEELKENKSIVTSYRLSQDTKDKVQKQLKDLDMTQEQYFNKVVSMMELENVKQNNIFAVNTTELQDLTQRIYNLFIGLCEQGNSFLSNKDTEFEELKAKYKEMLFNKDNSITKQCDELQHVYDNLSILQNENDNNKNELMNIRIDYDKQLEQMEGNLADKTSLIQEYKTKNDDLLSIVSEYKQYKIQVEEYKKLLSDAQAKNIEKDNVIKNKDFAIDNLNKDLKSKDNDINNLKLKYDEGTKQFNDIHIQELEQLKKGNELNIKLAVAEAKEELNNKLNQEQMKHNKEIEGYQNKYKSLLEELEKVKITPKPTKKNTVTI